MRRKLCAVSVDLDPIRFYEQIHGIPAVPAVTNLVYSTAIERLSSWARAQAIPLTWFVVGTELDAIIVQQTLQKLYQSGDELANHTEHHHYDLTQRSRVEMRREVELATIRLTKVTRESTFGFRAPGYRMTDALVSVLREMGVIYDSSVFPCPVYWAAKATVMFGQRVLGRRSRAILDHPKVLLGPRLPYNMGNSYLGCGDGLLELPISVTPGLRLPFIGTSLCLMGNTAARVTARSLGSESFVNLELHGIDALDTRDGLENLAKTQPDVKRDWPQKLETLDVVIAELRRAGFSFVTLREVARQRG